jgi:fatty-acyl-CoA synthase
LQVKAAKDGVAFKRAGFSTLIEALEYAAQGDGAVNFYGSRGEAVCSLSYAELRDDARALGRGLLSLGYDKGSRLAIVAETEACFHRFFFACQYAGMVPVPLPAGIQMGAHDSYVKQLRQMLTSCGAVAAVSPSSHIHFLQEAAAQEPDIKVGLPDDFPYITDASVALRPLAQDDLAYLQYTSGSTRFPRGVEITQHAALWNVEEISVNGLNLDEQDRFVSWLPLYHDMGLVGFVLLPLVNQLSADLLSPRTFAMRPRLWLKILSDNRGTISSSPPFGYALCARRLRAADTEKYDLSYWRAACVGADRIYPKPLRDFARALAPAGFKPSAFVACYGMAECALAVSFAPLNTGFEVDVVSRKRMSEHLLAEPVVCEDGKDEKETLLFVDCGSLLPSYEMCIRDARGFEVNERCCGTIFLRGPSVMRGYFQNPVATAEVLDQQGWLNTGDIGYRVGDRIYITARGKDVIIINGRNVWPQDLEHLADGLHGVRQASVSAFAASTVWGEEVAVLVVESRERETCKREQISTTLTARAHAHFGIHVYVDLVEPGVVSRTSSGKLSRAKTRTEFYARAPAEFSQFRVNGAAG